ncbi:MAG: hypothetical protein AABZ55_06690, partial [Bdellovibrionota bacterium]
MFKFHPALTALILFTLSGAIVGCESKLDLSKRFPVIDDSVCPVFDIQTMNAAGISLPAVIDGFVIAAPATPVKCNGLTGYRSLYVYSPLVPSGDSQMVAENRSGHFKVKIPLKILPWNNEVQYRLRDQLKGNPELFKINGSFQELKPLGDLDLDFVLKGDHPFSLAHYPNLDRSVLEFVFGSDASSANEFVKNFNSGRERLELIHNEVNKPHSGLGTEISSLFFTTTLTHPSQSQLHSLSPLQPANVLRKVWLRAHTDDEKKEIVSGAIEWLARFNWDLAAHFPAFTEISNFCKLNWSPFPTLLDDWAIASMRWISLTDPNSNARAVNQLQDLIIKTGEEPKFAFEAAVEVVQGRIYNTTETQQVLELSKKIRQSIRVDHPWTAARYIFDRLARNQEQSEQSIRLAAWLVQELIVTPPPKFVCFTEAVDVVLLFGLTLDQVQPIYREVIQWANLSSRKDFVWAQTKSWAKQYMPTQDQLLNLRQFYTWLSSAGGFAWDPEHALLVAQGYVLGSFQATPAQVSLFKSTIKWLRSPEGPHIVASESLMQKSQFYIFDKKMDDALLLELISAFNSHLLEG